MNILPVFRMEILNGWLPLVMYLAGFLVAVMTFSKEARGRLFDDPKDQIQGIRKLLRSFGQLAMVACIVLMVFTPLQPSSPLFIVGVVVYVIGYSTVIISLHSFKRASVGQPVVDGPYRVSRNPQWVGLFLVFIGIAISTATWLYIGILIGVAIIYHTQILAEEALCIRLYGDSYRSYMNRVSRYFMFF